MAGEESSEDIKKESFSNNVLEYSKKQLLYLDKNFDFESFLENAKSAFNLIVSSYKNDNLKKVQTLLSSQVFKAFEESIPKEKNGIGKFQINFLEASIIHIDVIENLAKIKVEFLSIQEVTVGDETKQNEIKDIWTFEKDMKSQDPIWILTEVNSE